MKQPIEEPFGFSIERTGPHVFTVTYSGHMPETAHHLDRTESIVLAEREPVGLLYEVPGFTSFHRSQVSLHGAMFARLGKRVTGIAVVGARPLVRFGATTVGLISKTPLTSFDTRAEALAWLEEQNAAARRSR